MVRWEDVVTDDPYPYIKKGTEVEYFSADGDHGKLTAKRVTLVGGAKIPVFTKPHNDREVNNEDIYTGAIDSYKRWKGFGFLKLDEEITWKDTTTSGNLFFSKVEIFTATPRKRGYRFAMQKGDRVSFKIYKDKKGIGACQIKKEDGTPIEQESIEESRKKDKEQNRKRKLAEGGGGTNAAKKAKTAEGNVGNGNANVEYKPMTQEELKAERQIDKKERVFTGRVKKWKTKQKFGYIIPSTRIEFLGMNTKRGIFAGKDDIICFSEEVGLNKGSKVKFLIYKNSRGLGAYDIRNIDDTPIFYQPVKKIETEKKEPKITAVEEPEPEQSEA